MKLALCTCVATAVLFGVPAGGSAQAQQTVTVAAAANLSGVIRELKELFVSAHNNVSVQVISGSSGRFAAQALNGAPFDVFLSADMDNPQKLADAGFAAQAPVRYAQGRLIMFTAGAVDITKGVAVAASPDVAKISIADPALAPYGAAAVEAMENARVLETARPKFVTASNIAEVVTQTVNGADLGFTALAMMHAESMKQYDTEGKYWAEVDPSLYHPIDQGMVILRHGRDNPAAKAFYDFILSKPARTVFRRHGYK